MKSPYSFSRGPVGMPTVLVLVGSLGLLALWPGANARLSARKHVPVTRIVFARALDRSSGGVSELIFMTAPTKGGADRDDPAFEEALWSPPKPRPHFLERQPTAATQTGIDLPLALTDHTAPEARRYRPRWGRDLLFPVPSGDALRLVVGLSPALLQQGFVLPADVFDPAGMGDASWEVHCRIVCGADGRIAHVLVEKSSGSKEIDRFVESSLYKADTNTGSGCDGLLTISWSNR